MKFFLFLLLLFFSNQAFAWTFYNIYQSRTDSSAAECREIVFNTPHSYVAAYFHQGESGYQSCGYRVASNPTTPPPSSYNYLNLIGSRYSTDDLPCADGFVLEPQDGNYFCNLPPDPSDYDPSCEAIKPDYVTLPVDPGLGFFWDSAGCTFYTSDVVPCLETPSGQYSCIVTDAYAHEIEPPADDPISDDIDRDSSSEYTATSDPANDCPFSNVSWAGQSYCYNGPDASQGAEYADGSSRVNHYDGSYTVYDNQGQGVTYNPDGSPSGTASTSPGAVGPGTDNSGCPPWAPKWLCDRDSESLAVTVGDGDGTTAGELAGMLDGAEGGGEMPIEFIDPMQNQSDWSTGLATTGVCPVPSDINISFGPVNHSFQISYLPFCQFAEYLRYIIIAMAYLAASMIAYRGLV